VQCSRAECTGLSLLTVAVLLPCKPCYANPAAQALLSAAMQLQRPPNSCVFFCSDPKGGSGQGMVLMTPGCVPSSFIP
jgi:hypothetical protein